MGKPREPLIRLIDESWAHLLSRLIPGREERLLTKLRLATPAQCREILILYLASLNAEAVMKMCVWFIYSIVWLEIRQGFILIWPTHRHYQCYIGRTIPGSNVFCVINHYVVRYTGFEWVEGDIWRKRVPSGLMLEDGKLKTITNSPLTYRQWLQFHFFIFAWWPHSHCYWWVRE